MQHTETLIGEESQIEVEEAPPPSDADLKSVQTLAARYVAVANEIADLESALERKNAEFKAIREHDLPLAMTTLGLRSFELVGGGSLKVKKTVVGGLSKDRQQDGFAWLEKHGHGGIIKHEIKVIFSKGEDSWARKFMADLAKRKKPVRAERKDFIAPQTLGAFIREQWSGFISGQVPPDKAIPKDLFGIQELTYAELELPNGK